MRQAFRVLWRGLVIFERYGSTFVIANIVSLFVALPIVTAPAAFAGLMRLAHAANAGPTAHLDDFWAGFRAHFGRALIVGALNVAVFYMLWVNFNTYALQTGGLFVILRYVWLVIGFVWIMVQLYLWPILEEMERPDLLRGLYNAAVMVLQNPFFSFAILLSMFVIALISAVTVLPWALLTLSLIACIANAAVLDRLAIFRSRAQ